MTMDYSGERKNRLAQSIANLVTKDSGWRSLSLTAPFRGNVYVRRVGNKISIVGAVRPGTGVTSFNGIFVAIPEGFRPQSAIWCYHYVRATEGAAFTLNRRADALGFENSAAVTDAAVARFEFDYVVRDGEAWPAILPGTPHTTV